MTNHPRGSIVTGTVKSVEPRGAVVELADGVDGYIRASDIAKERVEDATRVLSEGDEIEAKFVALDRKSRNLTLSIRAKDDDELAAAVDQYKQSCAGTLTTMRDVRKEEVENKDD